MSAASALLSVRDLDKRYELARSARAILTRQPRRHLHALRQVSLDLAPGETLGIVGESGCGKSTLARCMAGLEAPDGGEILWRGEPLAAVASGRVRARRIQMVFQDPYASLNPRMSLAALLDEVLTVHGLAATRPERRDRVDELLTTVGLAPRLRERLPHALSGGQRQRVSIARALAVSPEVLIADEPVSALDASIQAQIINLLEDLRERRHISLIFISHDLNVVRHISDRIAVMYLGQVVETARTDALFAQPSHPYTRALLAAIPKADPTQRSTGLALAGELPDPAHPPTGCGFSSRCPWAVARCSAEAPALLPLSGQRLVRCSNPDALAPAVVRLSVTPPGDVRVLPG